MAHKHVLIQGIPVPDGQAPPLRKEFSEWATSTPDQSIQVSLFIRALQRFYDVDYRQTLSYFQVAGIHGYPGYGPWDNSLPPPYKRENDPKHKIYCTHNLCIFPTWHRAYMLLFEQTIWVLMGEVINDELEFNTEKDRQTWEAEKDQWRLPYWDWARNEKLPDLFIPEFITICRPDGSSEQKMNPLFRFELKVDGKPTKMGTLKLPYTIDDVVPKKGPVLPCSGTSRWGIKSLDPEDWSQGVNNFEAVETAIKTHKWYPPTKDPVKLPTTPVRDVVYRLLTSVKTWQRFSTTQFQDTSRGWEDWVSLEYIHNNLHGFIGGGDLASGLGHMQSVPVSAFDPAFWMHHCYVDCQLAIWQTLHNETWITDGDLPPAKEILPPFHHEFKDKTVDYFKSSDLRDWRAYGYEYDVLQRIPGEDEKAYVQRIHAWVDSTYNGTSQLLLNGAQNVLGAKGEDHVYDDYLIDVIYDRNALDGDPYTIHFILTDTTESELATSAVGAVRGRHVGSIYNFSSPWGTASDDGPGCANCDQQRDDAVLSRAQIPLTIPLYHLVASGGTLPVPPLDPDVIGRYLKEQLKWIAISTSGEIIPWHELNRTKVFVVNGKARHYPTPSELSEYSNYKPLPIATDGKSGGAVRDDYSNWEGGFQVAW